MKILAILVLCLCLSSCLADAHKSIQIGKNDDIQVDTLFTVDGCTVYRFNDGGTKYFTRCENSVKSTTLFREGKHDAQIETN